MTVGDAASQPAQSAVFIYAIDREGRRHRVAEIPAATFLDEEDARDHLETWALEHADPDRVSCLFAIAPDAFQGVAVELIPAHDGHWNALYYYGSLAR